MKLLRTSIISLSIGAFGAGCASVGVKEAAEESNSTVNAEVVDSVAVGNTEETVEPKPVVVTKVVEAKDPFAKQRNGIVTAINSGEYEKALHRARAMLSKVPENSDDRFLLEAIIALTTAVTESSNQAAQHAVENTKLKATIAQKDEALEKLRQLMVDQ